MKSHQSGAPSLKPGRNDPCPCGSGARYKLCCGRLGFGNSPVTPGTLPGEAAGQVEHSQDRALTTAQKAELAALMGAGRYRDLESLARELARQYPACGFAWKALGVALDLQRKDALPAMARAAQLLPDDAEAHGNLGIGLLASGQPENALAHFRRALQIAPGRADVHNNLANVLRSLGQMEDAVVCYHRALAIEPARAELHHNLGNALRALKRIDAAIASLRQAVTLKSDYAEAHSSLGNALLDRGQIDEALASHRRALELKPEFAEAHNNLGNALMLVDRVEEAERSYRRALEITADYAEVHNNLGNALRTLGRPEEAAASCRQALQLRPDYAEAHGNLGNALLELERLDEAVASHRRALALKPDFAEGYVNLAIALRLQGRTAEAEASCRDALTLNPSLAAAVAVLADAHADQGQFAQAEKTFLRAIALEPDMPQAWAGLAYLRRMTPGDAAWLSSAQRIAAQNPASANEVLLRYAIGKYLDDVGDFDRAFASYQRANELEQRHRIKHDRQHFTRSVDRLLEAHDRQWLDVHRARAASSERALFIVGMPRSGTSLAEQILASHPQVFGAGELTFWGGASERYQSSARGGEAGDAAPRVLADDYLRLLGQLADAPLRVVDKTPDNFLHLGLIHAALPNARIIHLRRDPLDTCLSIYFQHFKASLSYANDLGDLAHYYAQYARVMQHWQALLPEHTILHVPYEGLAADTEGWSRRMLEFIGLPWDPRCLDFHETRRSVVTASKWQVRQKTSTSSVARWRNYEQHLGPLRALLPAS